jgi:hypothetical protein
MIKYLIFFMIPTLATACFTHDEDYYRLHIKALEDAIYHCPDVHPKQVTCVQLQQMASRINMLSNELRTDPQLFGQKIMMLQAALYQTSSPLMPSAIAEHQMELNDRLAVVKWLESPGA